MATQHVERNLLLNLYREENILLVCFFLLLKRAKNVWHLQTPFSTWRPLAFLPVTLSVDRKEVLGLSSGALLLTNGVDKGVRQKGSISKISENQGKKVLQEER